MQGRGADEQKVFFALAALAYRGFADAEPEAIKWPRLRALIGHGLEETPALSGGWEWAYGPATHRSPLATFDDELLFAVRGRQDPNQLVIALRGTNPIGVFDWMLGDFLVGMQVPWPCRATAAGARAHISLSTALGLSIVRRMRVEAAPAGGLSSIWDALGAAAATAEIEAIDRLRSLAGWAESLPGIARLRAAYRGLSGGRHALVAAPFEAQLEGARDRWTSELRHELFEHLAVALSEVDNHCSASLLPLLDGPSALDPRAAPGVDLRSFLAGFVEQAGGSPVDIVVTGHSKGGALAHALALWLADTRDAGAEPAWDPRRLATVRCFSYGAPTIGDAGFAEHATTVLGDDLHRIVNPLDVVPHTWSVDDLTRIGGLYGDLVEPMPGLGDLIEQVGAGVRRLAYRHAPARETTTLPSTLDPDRRSFVDQMTHQHLAAYLRAFDLDMTIFE